MGNRDLNTSTTKSIVHKAGPQLPLGGNKGS